MKIRRVTVFLVIIFSFLFISQHCFADENMLWDFEGVEALKWTYFQFSSNAGVHGSGNPNSVANPGQDAVNESDSCASIKAEVTSSSNGMIWYIDYKGGAIDVSQMKRLHVKMLCSEAYTWRAKLRDANGRLTLLTYADYKNVNEWQDLVFDFTDQFVNTDGEFVDSTKIYQIEFSAGDPFDITADVYFDEVRFNDDPVPYGYFEEHMIWDFDGMEGLKWTYNQMTSNAGVHGSGNPNAVVNPDPDQINLSDSCASIHTEVTGGGNGMIMYIDYKGGAIDVSNMKLFHIKMYSEHSHVWRAKLTGRGGNRTVLTYCEYTDVNNWQDLVFDFRNQFKTGTGDLVDSTGIYQIEFSAGEPFDLVADVYLDEVRFNTDPNPYQGSGVEIPLTPLLTLPESSASGETYIVNWTASANHTHYYLEEDTHDDFSTAIALTISADSTAREFMHEVDGIVTYYYRVRAENSDNGTMSAWSNIGLIDIGTDTSDVNEFMVYDFEGINETVQWQLVDFESVPGVFGGWKAFPKSVANTDNLGINSSDSCGYLKARVENAPQQITIWLNMPGEYLDVRDMPYLHIMMKCDKQCQWKAQLYDGTYKTDYFVTSYSRPGTWQDLVFDYKNIDLQNLDLAKARHIKLRYEGATPFYSDSLYLDQVRFSSDPVPKGELPGPTISEITAPYAALSGDNYLVEWTASENHTIYVLQEAENGQFANAIEMMLEESVMNQTFMHELVAPNTYYYRVKATHVPTDKSSAWSNVVSTIVVPDTLKPATLVLAGEDTVKSGESFELSWSTCVNITRYALQESMNEDFNDAETHYLGYDVDSELINRIVGDNTTFYYRIRGENELADEVGDWSNVIKVMVNAVEKAEELGCGTTFTGKLMPENYEDFPAKAAGDWWIEKPYNTKVIRVTDYGEANNTYAYHRYSSVCVFNHTGDYFIMTHKEGEVWLHDGRNGVPIKRLEIDYTTCVWSMVDENLIYYNDDNKFMSYNIMTNEKTLVHHFPLEVGMDFGGNEGDISNDGRYVCLSSTNRSRWFVYDIFNDIKHDVLDVDDSNLIDAAQISPSGKYVVIEYGLQSANDYTEGVGCCLHDAKTMAYIRNLYYPKTQHNDVGFDDDGDEAMFITDVMGDFSGGGPSAVVSIKMENAEKKLLHHYDENTWTIYHFSQRCCMNRHDYVFCSLYTLTDVDPNTSSWKPYWNEILAIPTDTSRQTVRLAPTRVNMGGEKKWALEPRASVNRQGDRVVFTSNLNGDNIWCDQFMITLEEPDTIPPYEPENIALDSIGSNQITLSWDAPTPAEDGDVPRNYKVYRDSLFLGYTYDLFYMDTTIVADEEYTYHVFSLDESAVASVNSATITTKSEEDTEAPEITQVVPLGLNALAVHFNETVDAATALDKNNYQVNNSININRMILACKKAVLIETSTLEDGKLYTITVSGISDESPNKNTMPGAYNMNFTAQEGVSIGFNDVEDNFDNEDLSLWNPYPPELWSFVDDMGRKTFGTNTSDYNSPGPGLLGAYALIKDKVYTDFTFSCDVRTPDGNSGADLDFLWNYQDNVNYNYVMFNRVPQLNELFGVVDSLRYTISNFGEFDRFELMASDYRNVRIHVKSGHFEVFFDDSLVVEGDDEAFLYGQVGIGSFNDWVYFDNFQLTVDDEYITGVENTDRNHIPEFRLADNYPNPFNPVTTIEYTIPRADHVTVTIYNVVGQRVMQLINKKQNAGNHRITWDAKDASSGLYFYELKTGNYCQKKKMLLMK